MNEFKPGDEVVTYDSGVRFEGAVQEVCDYGLEIRVVLTKATDIYPVGTTFWVHKSQLKFRAAPTERLQPQTKEETMNDIDAKLADSINDYFKQNPNAMLKECAETLDCDLELVWDVRSAVIGHPERHDTVTLLDDLKPSSITDGLVVQPSTGCGTKPIPTLAGAMERDGKIVLPMLNDIVNERDKALQDKLSHEERMQLQTANPSTRDEWDGMLVKAGGKPSTDTAWERHHRSALEAVEAKDEQQVIDEQRDADEEDVSDAIFELASLLQLLATNYDYGSEEEYLEAQEFIMTHRRALKFLAIQADQIDGIIEEEEMEEAENE